MSLSVAVLMDPITGIHIEKDSTFALLLEAQRRRHQIYYCTQSDLAIRDGSAWARLSLLEVRDNPVNWFTLRDPEWRDLHAMDVIFARKDPPLNDQFLYDTMVLEIAQSTGVLVINHPQAIRDANEKLFSLQFPQCIPPTLIARELTELKRFVGEYGEVVLKPLDGMGGRGIFRTYRGDPNLTVIIETVTQNGTCFAAVQKFIPEISTGDKRILMIDGEPIPYALARIPQGDDFRGNLARGGKGVGIPLSKRDFWIASEVGPELKRRGLLFVGLDVIGDYLTEINVTSPTCIRELDKQFRLNIAGQLFDVIEKLRR